MSDEQQQQQQAQQAQQTDSGTAAATTAPMTPTDGIKHPLENAWTLWFDKGARVPDGVEWFTTVMKVYTFSTVEDFWGVYNNIVKPSELAHGNYYLFKQGIEPRWEHADNKKGGKYQIELPQSSKNKPDFLDNAWQNSVLQCIGEQMSSNPDEVNGVLVQRRPKKEDRIALWTRSSNMSDLAHEEIGKKLRDIVLSCFPKENISCSFHPHDSTPAHHYSRTSSHDGGGGGHRGGDRGHRDRDRDGDRRRK